MVPPTVHPIAAATHCAHASTARSSPRRPTIWIPSGSPFGPVPAGTVTHGTCKLVQMKLKSMVMKSLKISSHVKKTN